MVDAVWFLRGMDEVCLVRVAMAMSNRTLAPGEVAPMRHLYVVSRGLVLYGGKVLSYGMAWGDDVILSDSRYFKPLLARAMWEASRGIATTGRRAPTIGAHNASATGCDRIP